MAGKHRRAGIVASGVSWQNTVESSRGWFTPVIEPATPTWPKRDQDTEAAREEARRVALATTPRTRDELAKIAEIFRRP
ncbi:hypothetical protein ACH347_31730 [Saccharopolyspora sp. 5N102]|uniref:hypothetical protein n=1 Tax=Saccharopolyspora sp. 5N102 TaxID=3375155 RepID=UPI0037AF78E8